MMKIAQFSKKTGISSSALRFYENKKLLIPAQRLDNGYRVYTEDQVSQALFIHSLRQASVQIADIRRFLSEEMQGKQRGLLEDWVQETEMKLLGLQIAKQYISGMIEDEPPMILFRWDKHTTMLWHEAIVANEPDAVRRAIACIFESYAKRLPKPEEDTYVRMLEVTGDSIRIEIGFRLDPKHGIKGISDNEGVYRVETIPPTLFACLECEENESFLCVRLVQFLQRYGYKPAGKRIEKYTMGQKRMLMMIPLLKIQSGLNA